MTFGSKGRICSATMTCAWMHRIDLAEATGKPFNVDADNDGRILADLVAEWATTHGLPFVLS
jgi:hypothetical protein